LNEYLTEGKKKNQIKQKAKYTTNAQYTYTQTVLDDTKKGDFAASQGGLSRLCPLRSDGCQDSQTGGTLKKGGQRLSKLS
jgi:hypothetical protein